LQFRTIKKVILFSILLHQAKKFYLMIQKLYTTTLAILMASTLQAQVDTTKDISLDDLMATDTKTEKVFAYNAFKSSRVIMGQSMEMLGAGVLDTRILHRFGTIQNGFADVFGLDYASMRIGFDYGINKNLAIGIGRSTLAKEADGFIKYRILHQHTGAKATPLSLLYVGGITSRKVGSENTDRLAYYHQLIVGRKFSNKFSLQLSPTFLHQNWIASTYTSNDMVSLGVGTRYKLSQRIALVVDAFPLLYGGTNSANVMPLSIGVDLETGGHVFQMHFSNARGMSERAYMAETNQRWDKSQFQFGFNLSRVFTIKENTKGGW
jgi:Membrane bound beta barrel domain (DUF5777)